MKIVLPVLLLTIVGLLGMAFSFHPQEATFAQTEEMRGRIAYSGRYADARLDLRRVFTGADVLGGTNGGFADVPNGTEMVARVAQVRTLLGPVRVVVRATSAVDGRALIERTPAQCVAAWTRATFSALSTAHRPSPEPGCSQAPILAARLATCSTTRAQYLGH